MMSKVVFLYISIVCITFIVVATQDVIPESNRKVWSVCTNDSCSCGSDLQDTVLCNDDNLFIQPCYCMYFDSELNITILGNCMPTCYYVHYHVTSSRNYYEISRYSIKEGTNLNDEICAWDYAHLDMHREGRFCGSCEEGYGLAAYSYHHTSCVPCTDYGYKNWLKYFAVALLPLTVFYFIVVIVKLNVPSSHLNGTVFVLQSITSSMQLRTLDGLLVTNGNMLVLVIPFKFFTTIFGFTNLDFFRTLYPYNCLHPKLNILHLVSLDFIIAFYPFFLIFVTYVLVTMYDKNYRILVWAWQLVNKCCMKQFDVKSSLIQTFATFILFSNVKILGICFDLLAVTKTYNASGVQTSKWYLLYDANIEYFSLQHLPFALLALTIGFLFVFLPFLLLLLYPCSGFHRCLDFFSIRFPALHIFMDAFQGSYRTSPHDMRLFSVFYLILRFVLLFSINSFASAYYIPFNAFILTVSTLLIAFFRPYKNNLHNLFDLIALFSLSLYYIGFSAFVISVYIYLHQKFWGILFWASPLLLMSVHALIAFLYGPKLKSLILRLLCVVRKLIKRDVEESLHPKPLEAFDADCHTPLL